MKTSSVLVQDKYVYYTSYGDKKKKLLLVHGFGIGSSIWNDIPQTLSDAYTVITLDLPGYGLNKEIDTSTKLSEQAQFLASFIQNCPIEYLVTYSYGARVSYEMSKTFDIRLEKHILISPPFFLSPLNLIISGIFYFGSKSKFISSTGKKIGSSFPFVQLIIAWFGIISLSKEDIIKECIKKFRAEENVPSIFKSISYIFQPFRETFQTTENMWFIYGELDGLAKVKTIKYLLKNTTHKLHILKDVAHLVPLEDPKGVVEKIQKILN